jgi:hypothetical protein
MFIVTYMYKKKKPLRRKTMKKTALALAAVLALSGSAFATDFAATLQYPVATPRLDAVASKPAKALDYSSTGSIKQKTVKSSAQPSGAAAVQPKAKAK